MLIPIFLFISALPASTAIGESLDVDTMVKAFLGMGSMFTANVETVDVDTDRLMGQWHQMYKAAMNFDVFRTSMYCEVAYFLPNSVLRRQGGFEMLEAYRVTDKNGNVEVYKRDVSRSQPGRFWMHTKEYFYPREFNVVKVGGPMNGTEATNGTLDSYDYIIVTDSRRTSLMVFARDPTQFRDLYSDQVFEYFKNECFGNGCFWNQAEKIYQEADCVYPTEQEIKVRRALKAHLFRGPNEAPPPPRSFLQNALSSPNRDRQPSVQFTNQNPVANIFSGIDPLEALQGFFANLPAISSSLTGKK